MNKSRSFFLFIAFLALFFPSTCAAGEEDAGEWSVYRNNKAHFTIKVPAGASIVGEESSRIAWTFVPWGDVLISLRINWVFIGVSIDSDEYIAILQESKKNEGMEVSPANIGNGKGFFYEAKAKKSDDDQQNLYLVAASRKGWICTLTASAKWSVLKKELKIIREIMQSFEFVDDGRSKG
jgi:hypothetical protein